MKKIIIAIDGYSACGKSTTAIEVARALSYVHIDTGAMYRAVALYFLRNNIEITAANSALIPALDRINLSFQVSKISGESEVCLNGENVEQEIRSAKVSDVVSEVAAIKAVRVKMVALQQMLGRTKGVVMDGRDIGTVVFPDAELKIFMTATMARRVERRLLDLHHRGLDGSRAEVEANIRHRDHIDTTREESPLRKAADALLLDNTELTFDEQVELVINRAISTIGIR